MFVSSYNTYLQTNTAENSTKNKEAKTTSFSTKMFQKPAIANSLSTTPINYISDNKVINTKAQIQQQFEKNTLDKNNQTSKFTKISSQMKASSAYTANSTMFSLVIKNQQTPKQNIQYIDQNLPQEIKDIKESFLRNKMVNTYIANNNYYQITA